MRILLKEIRHNPLLWLLAFVPGLFIAVRLQPAAHTWLFVMSVLLIAAYGLGMWFSLKTHRELFGSEMHDEEGDEPWPIRLALATLAGVTVVVALVSEIFVESVQKAAETFGMTQAFVGFIVVALVGGAAEMGSAFSGARKNRLDLSVGIALGSAAQIALFVAPVLVLLSYFIGPQPMDLQFWPGAVVMMLIATLTASMVTNSGRSAGSMGLASTAMTGSSASPSSSLFASLELPLDETGTNWIAKVGTAWFFLIQPKKLFSILSKQKLSDLTKVQLSRSAGLSRLSLITSSTFP